ncbi:MAG: SUF system NifU family Fe-S cluster assembly protein [Elusimicrobia bacterium]|nr:SUF system NifU family Fe-S cluster assembly protein [Elusimicrobiota bacterium]
MTEPKSKPDAELEDLYREVLLDYYQDGRHRGRAEPADLAAEGVNPLCGDQVILTAHLQNGTISQARFQGQGCAISQASTAILTEALEGKTLSEASRLVDVFKGFMLQPGAPQNLPETLESAEALGGVKKYPVRIKCALLSWNTFLEGLRAYREGQREAKHTE